MRYTTTLSRRPLLLAALALLSGFPAWASPPGTDTDGWKEPDAAVYLMNQFSALRMFSLDHHRRVTAQGNGRSWVLIDARRGTPSVRDDIAARSGGQALQLGSALVRTESGSGFGVVLVHGDTRQRASRRAGTALDVEARAVEAQGSIHGSGIGVYGVWQSQDGRTHLDGWVQRQSFEARLQRPGVGPAVYAGTAWQAAVEVGHSAELGAIALQPRLQVGTSRLDMDPHVAMDGRLIGSNAVNIVFGRLGLRVAGTHRHVHGVASVHPFLQLDWIRDDGAGGIRVDGAALRAQVARSRWLADTGLRLNFASGISVSGAVSTEWSRRDRASALQLGLGYTW